jgi:hypothetical protein
VWWLAVARETDAAALDAALPALGALVAVLADVDTRLQASGGLRATAAVIAQVEAALRAVDMGDVQAARAAAVALEESLHALADRLVVLRALRDDADA